MLMRVRCVINQNQIKFEHELEISLMRLSHVASVKHVVIDVFTQSLGLLINILADQITG